MLKVAVIVGTRPEAIKMAPLVLEMRRVKATKPVLVLTAQHREMCDDVLEVFGLKPDHDLDIMRPNQSLFEVTSSLVTELEGVLRAERPDLVLVQGDTTSTFVGSLCAYYLRIPGGARRGGPEDLPEVQPVSRGDQPAAHQRHRRLALCARPGPRPRRWPGRGSPASRYWSSATR